MPRTLRIQMGLFSSKNAMPNHSVGLMRQVETPLEAPEGVCPVRVIRDPR